MQAKQPEENVVLRLNMNNANNLINFLNRVQTSGILEARELCVLADKLTAAVKAVAPVQQDVIETTQDAPPANTVNPPVSDD